MFPRRSSSRVMMESLESREMFAASAVISVSDITVPVGATSATFTATVQGTLASPVTLKFFAIDGTAHGKRDFTYTKSTVMIAAGATSATFSIPLLNDPVFARLRQFKVHVDVEGSNARGFDATASIIAPAPMLSLRSVAYVSAKGLPNPNTVSGPYVLPAKNAQRSFILTFAISRPSGNRVSFNFALNSGSTGSSKSTFSGGGRSSGGSASSSTSSDLTAISGVDFVAPAMQTVTFPPGKTIAKVKVTLLPSATAQTARKDFNLTITNLVGAVFSSSLSNAAPSDTANEAAVNIFIGEHDANGNPIATDVPTGVNQIIV
jgi:hypothetical protein